MTLFFKKCQSLKAFTYTGYSVLQLQCKLNADQVKYKIDTVYIFRITLVPEVYFYYFHCEGERKNKPWVESGN